MSDDRYFIKYLQLRLKCFRKYVNIFNKIPENKYKLYSKLSGKINTKYFYLRKFRNKYMKLNTKLNFPVL